MLRCRRPRLADRAIGSGSPSLTDAAARFVLLTAAGAVIDSLIGLGAVAVLRVPNMAFQPT